LEWVDNTEPLKNIIQRELAEYGENDLRKTPAYQERIRWLGNLQGNTGKTVQEQHIKLLSLEDKDIVDEFNIHRCLIPWDLLRKGLENMCLTSESFLSLRSQFIKSLATFSVCSYILGIGDRHLENFLIDKSDGEVLGIDFGVAFGNGLQLGIPELMPFRLTRQIEGVLAPLGLSGLYKYTMIHALSALRQKKNVVLDCCEIFVKEPLLDWVKVARAKASFSHVEPVSGSIYSQQDLEELSWYPKKKLEFVRDKLEGKSSSLIMIEELKDTRHIKQGYIKKVNEIISGRPGINIRYDLSKEKEFLDVEEQVNCLIDHARDPNILGRTWIGWSPFV